MLGNFLGFGRMHENKIFLSFFCLLKREINLNILRFVFNFFLEIFWRKPGILISDMYLTM